MKGHEPLIAMRRKGHVPVGGLMVDTSPAGSDRWAGDWGKLGMSMAFVDIQPRDSLHDLRFAFGLAVQVSGEDTFRVGQVAQAFVAAGASRVIAGVGRYIGEDYHVERMAFTNEEVKQWPM